MRGGEREERIQGEGRSRKREREGRREGMWRGGGRRERGIVTPISSLTLGCCKA